MGSQASSYNKGGDSINYKVIVMTYYEKLEGPAMEAWRKSLSAIKQRAMTELKVGEEGIIVRQLRPDDIGASSNSSTFNVSSAGWNTIINAAQIANNRFVSINGVLVAESGTSVVSMLRVTRMGQVVRYWNVQDINFLQSPIIYFDDPITVDQNTSLTIEAYGMATDSSWRCNFLGNVAERKGLLVV